MSTSSVCSLGLPLRGNGPLIPGSERWTPGRSGRWSGRFRPAPSLRLRERQRKREELLCLTENDLSVWEFQGSSRGICLFRKIYSGRNNNAVLRGDLCLLHDQFDLVCLVLAGIIFYDLLKSLVVAADDLLAGSLAHASSSKMQRPAMLTPISVGDLYGHLPKIPSKMALSTG